MKFLFDNDRPIYIQLVEQLKESIISGIITPGERLPSVRDFALQTQVNPNTMQKALSELEEAKLIYTERTNGKFVTTDVALIEQIKNELAQKKVQVYLSDMQKLGFSIEEAMQYLKK